MDRQSEPIRFVVGLGNPTRRYAKTRHNIGWMVLETLRQRWDADSGKNAFCGQLYEARCPDGETNRRVTLFEPQLYMNRSGEPVKGLLGFYKADVRNVLVVLDDMALPLGRLRARAEGSAGGHNGLKDVLRLLGTERVSRLRIGIGASPAEMDPADYVLARFGPDETQVVSAAIDRAADVVEDWVVHGIRYVMDKYNRKDQTPDEQRESNPESNSLDNGSAK